MIVKAKSSHLLEPSVPEATGKQPSHSSHPGGANSEPVPPTWSLLAGWGVGGGGRKRPVAMATVEQLPASAPATWGGAKKGAHLQPRKPLRHTATQQPLFSLPHGSLLWTLVHQGLGPRPRRSRVAKHISLCHCLLGHQPRSPAHWTARFCQTGMRGRPELYCGDEVLPKPLEEGSALPPPQ